MDDIGWSVLGIAVLGGVGLFYALNNFALRSYSFARLQEAFREADKEKAFERFTDKEEKLIATCQVVRLLSNAGMFAVLASVMTSYGIGLLWVFVAAFVLVWMLSFIIPYSWAKHTSEAILLKTCRLLELSASAAGPILWVVSVHDALVRRLAGVSEMNPDQAQEDKQEEIMSLVEQGRAEGVVDAEEKEMIENVLELGDTTAEEIMTPRTDMVAIEADSDLQTVLKRISQAGHSRIPVYEGTIDNIIGLVYAKDLLAEIGKEQGGFRLVEKMRKAYFVPETKPLRVLLKEFQTQKLHIAVVLDEYGGTAGIVTIEDILEELVGEIVDEYEDMPAETLRKIDDRTVEIDARMYIDDLNDEFDLELPEDEDYDTAGGFVFSYLGYIPKSGETFEYGPVTFTVVSAEDRRINRLRIVKSPASDKSNE